MPGDFTLGCLLGQYDRAQSFDVASVGAPYTTNVGCWEFSAGSGDFIAGTDVHSSGQSLRWNATSSAPNRELFRYDYRGSNDAYGRWFPDVTTHAMRADYWARETTAAMSGTAYQDFGDIPGDVHRYIPYVGVGLAAIRAEGVWVFSGGVGGPLIMFKHAGGGATIQFVVEDMLTQVDPITLYPEYEFLEHSRLLAARHRTQGGVLHTYQWTRHFAWQVPLRFLSNSYADLINWWWVNGYPLVFTLDTSDQATNYTAKIVNETQPIGSKIKPYVYGLDGWAGVLELESLTQGDLVF